MGMTSGLTPHDKIMRRLNQAKEMEQIWNDSSDPIKMYLKGCIVTANTLAHSQDTGSSNDQKADKKNMAGKE